MSCERCIKVIKRHFFRIQVHVFEQQLHLLAGECALCQIMYSLAGLFWRNDLGCASVIPSEQTASSYIILYVKLQIFVRYLISYFRLETGSYVLIFVLSRVCEENDVEIQWLQLPFWEPPVIASVVQEGNFFPWAPTAAWQLLFFLNFS